MKKILFFLSIFCLVVYSCSKDEVPDAQGDEPITEMRTLLPSNTYQGVEGNGRWLIFQSQDTYRRVYDQLKMANDNYVDREGKDDSDGDKDECDTEYVLKEFESRFQFVSLRSRNLQEECRLYADGKHPKEVMPTLVDYGILDEQVLTTVSDEGVIQIGEEIRIARDNYTIITTKAEVAIDILDNGDGKVFDPKNLDDVEVIQFGGGLTTPECTADFENTSQTEVTNGTLASFTWASSMDLGKLSNVVLVWDFGDGSPKETESSGTTSHTFATPNTYNVCLDVSWTYEKEGQEPEPCTATHCEPVVIKEVDSDCSDELCDALQILSFLSIESTTNIFVDDDNSSPGNLCLNTSGIINFLVDFCADIDPSDITLSFNQTGQSFNGADGGCFQTCDGNRNIGISFGSCSFTIKVDFNQEPNCDDDDHDTGWKWMWYDTDKGISYRMETKSKENNFLGWGKNHIKSKMINKHFENNKFKRKKAKLGQRFSGTVKGDQSCSCDVSATPDEEKFHNSKKKCFTLEEKILNDIDGISADFTDCWFTDYFIDNNNIGQRDACQ